MTILTKASSGEKKSDKLVVPLFDQDRCAGSNPTVEPTAYDVEGQQNPEIVILKTRVRRVSSGTIFCLLLVSLSVVSLGIISGKYLYSQYISTQMQRFRGSAPIPFDDEDYNQDLIPDSALLKGIQNTEFDWDNTNEKNDKDNFDNLMRSYFQERFDIHMDDENYEKIDVPDFKDGRSGRFIHDFNSNLTGIIDLTGRRCFVMPLNRETVLPPKSLFDLVQKMWGGYYKVDTKVVRNTMKVITPPITDLKEIGSYIGKECEGRPVYKLEKYVGGVVKRSADLHVEAKFAQFSGNKITEFDIVNLEEVLEYEKNIH